MTGFFKTLRKTRIAHVACSGTVATEMALIAPVFFLMFMGICEVSLVMLAQHLIENATFNASRLGKTGYVAAGSTQQDQVKAKLMNELGTLSPLIDSSKVTFTTTYFGSLSQVATPAAGVAGLGTAGQVVVYTVTYPWTFFTPMIGSLMGDVNGVMQISARMVVKNEPY